MQIKDFLNKASRDSSDKLLVQASDDAYYHILISDFIKGLSTASSSGGGNSQWMEAATSISLPINSKTIVNGSNPLTLTLPSLIGDVEIFNNSSSTVNISLTKYKGASYTSNLKLLGKGTYTRLIWLDETIGWTPISGELEALSSYLSGMALWLENGSLLDKSGNARNASSASSRPPTIAVGLNNKNVLRWNGSSTQEVQINPFLQSATAATLYVVFSLNNNNQYNLLKTANIDDYWRFSGNGSGYIGTFSSSRRGGYPDAMPTTGNHLLSIHADSSSYEVLLNNVSEGAQSPGFSPGDRFIIGANDKPFNGDIALILVYPFFINKTSTEHTSIVNSIKTVYPSLNI